MARAAAPSAALRAGDGPELLAGPGDDLYALADTGDVYGATLGAERARQSTGPARVTVLAAGPLLARVEVALSLGGTPVVKTITIKADSPLVEITVRLAALPATATLVGLPTSRATASRTDDVGFAPYMHEVDNRPIVPGTVTYRRVVFYPMTAWTDVSADGAGLTLITHGLQGVAGTDTLSLLLVRQAAGRGGPEAEGVTDTEEHTFRYALLPHAGGVAEAQPWLAAYAFNQPLIPVWRTGDTMQIQLPFATDPTPRQLPHTPGGPTFPARSGLLAATSGLIADLACRGADLIALTIDYDPASPPVLTAGNAAITLPPAAVAAHSVPFGAGICRVGP